MMVAAWAVLMTSPVAAQTHPAFEFRGETTTATVNLGGQRGCRTDRQQITRCEVGFTDLGGVSVFLNNAYFGGHLFSVSGMTDGSHYQRLLQNLTLKYGPPVLTTPNWTSEAGQSFRNDVATWRFSDGTLTLSRMGPNRDGSQLLFDNPAGHPPAAVPEVNF